MGRTIVQLVWTLWLLALHTFKCRDGLVFITPWFWYNVFTDEARRRSGVQDNCLSLRGSSRETNVGIDLIISSHHHEDVIGIRIASEACTWSTKKFKIGKNFFDYRRIRVLKGTAIFRRAPIGVRKKYELSFIH